MTHTLSKRGLIARLACCIVLATALATAQAQRTEPLPEELEGVGITEHPNEPVPLDLEFLDEQGQTVKLGDFFDGRRPMVLTLNYYRCPMLCGLQLNGLIDALEQMSWTPGDEFDIVTISFDPLETPKLARLKKQSYIKAYGRPAAARGWHFLTGKPPSIEAITKAIGFQYKWVEERQQYAHVAAIYVCTPEGRLSRYLYGVIYDPRTLRLSLVEAAEGKIGSPLDQILLYCFHYDADARRYAPAAMNIMRAGGGLTAVLLGGTLVAFWVRDARKRKRAPTETES